MDDCIAEEGKVEGGNGDDLDGVSGAYGDHDKDELPQTGGQPLPPLKTAEIRLTAPDHR